jgi:16S rRNA U516 pseudouridylate synthase RsuA-like enzyme
MAEDDAPRADAGPRAAGRRNGERARRQGRAHRQTLSPAPAPALAAMSSADRRRPRRAQRRGADHARHRARQPRRVTVDGQHRRGPPTPRACSAFHKPSASSPPRAIPRPPHHLRRAAPKASPASSPSAGSISTPRGLLLLTNDGELKRALELPASNIPRTYRVRDTAKSASPTSNSSREGVPSRAFATDRCRPTSSAAHRPERVAADDAGRGQEPRVRRICEAMGLKVSRPHLRVAYGPLTAPKASIRARWTKSPPRTSQPSAAASA